MMYVLMLCGGLSGSCEPLSGEPVVMDSLTECEIVKHAALERFKQRHGYEFGYILHCQPEGQEPAGF